MEQTFIIGPGYTIEDDLLSVNEEIQTKLTKKIIDAMKKVKKVEFSKFFRGYIDGKIPDNVEELFLGKYFDSSVDHLPKNLKILGFDRIFNQKVDNLPTGLEELSLSEEFNQSIDNLPSSLKILYLSDEFNHPIDFLPSNLDSLTVGWSFQQSVDNLPAKLRKLKIGSEYEGNLDNLPDSIEKLRLPFYKKEIKKLPKSLVKIFIPEDYPYELPNGDYETIYIEDEY